MLNILIDSKEIVAEEGKTILEVAIENKIKIPTLCHISELAPSGACRICSVQIIGRHGIFMACHTQIEEGMKILTASPEILKARKSILKLLLNEHYADCLAPCQKACPAKIDVQSYVAAIANGQYHEAVKIIKEQLPMPLSIGRVCRAFCEAECRRRLVDSAVEIRALKRYCADIDLWDYWQWVQNQFQHQKNRKYVL